jgi:hypothetical protein
VPHATGCKDGEPAPDWHLLALQGLGIAQSNPWEGLPCLIGLVRLDATVPALAGYAQMYSSAMAPSRHLATVTMRAPSSNSPTTHVHYPEPNLIGWDAI